MKLLRALQTITLFSLFLAWPVWAADKPTTTVHRQMAGELDDSGWAVAKSTEGGFTVKTPGKFTDATAVASNPSASVAASHMIVSSTVQGIKFTATRIKFRGGQDEAIKQFNKLKLTTGKLKYKSLKPMTMNKHEAMEGELENSRSHLIQRTVLLDGELMTLIVEYPKTEEAVAKRLIPTYFSSLILE